ncbi:MAG TPA: energy transducer TonB [Candidatus Rubrimentiphilum sp.]|nr:energy transducer TonB [Candidatus Rubrimentiphilum sp.]
MKRVVAGFALVFGLVAFASERAQALTEICPAQLEVAAVSSTDQTTRGPAALFGFALTAMGPRTVSGKLAFDTTAGWFTVDVPPVALAEKDRHYNEIFGRLTIPDWVSRIMYVRFPTNVTLNHSWLYSATARSDGDFGWEKSGTFICPPPPGTQKANGVKTISIATSNTAGARRTFEKPLVDPKDVDTLSASPPPDALQIAAAASKALETANCAKPFQDGSVTLLVDPGYPSVLQTTGASGIIGVGLALNPDGTLADSWVWAPTGLAAFDQAAIAAVQRSKYVNAVAYCRPVPAIYNAYIMFNSR